MPFLRLFFRFKFALPTHFAASLVWRRGPRQGRGNGWFVLAVSSEQDTDDNNDEYKAFLLEVARKVIGDTPQNDGVIVIWEG